MIRRERKFYSEEFRERVLTAYYNSNESSRHDSPTLSGKERYGQ